MNKNITLSVEKAREMYKTANAEFKTLLEENFTKNELQPCITDRIKTMEDVYLITGHHLTPYSGNNLSKRQKSVNACFKLQLIAEAYNEGWEPDWFNTTEKKWFVYKYVDGSPWVVRYVGWGVCLYFPSGLYFKTEKLLKDAMEKFKDVFDDFLS